MSAFDKLPKYIDLRLSRTDVDGILEWYRCSHHFSKCGKGIRDCHSTKNKILKAAKLMTGRKEDWRR